eukprot:7337431-Prorocentrum_lima.AAC.1
MTSSLVGSEMCIRDSLIQPRSQESRGVWGVHVVSLGCKRGECGGGGDVAVSYTHLTLPTICSV